MEERNNVQVGIGVRFKTDSGVREKKGLKLFLMTYPSPGGGIFNLNDVVREAVRKYHVNLVDTELAFKGKSRGEIYFVADGHCTAKGYGLIAEHVYKALVKEKILPGERTEIVTHGG